MKKTNQKEEIQSRRDFFKKAAKTALPILGIAVLASNPIIAKASEKVIKSESGSGCWGCGYSCSSCIGSCFGCTGTCSGTCTSCTGTCTSCTGTCWSCTSCTGSCLGGCWGLVYY